MFYPVVLGGKACIRAKWQVSAWFTQNRKILLTDSQLTPCLLNVWEPRTGSFCQSFVRFYHEVITWGWFFPSDTRFAYT